MNSPGPLRRIISSDWTWLGVLLLVSFILGCGILSKGQDWGDDFAGYLMQASALRDGSIPDVIHHNHQMLQLSGSVFAPVVYPWGYPAVLAALWSLFGFHWTVFKVFNLVCLAGTLVVCHAEFRKRVGRWQSLLIVAMMAVNPALLWNLDYVGSDHGFLFLSSLLLWMLNRRCDSESRLSGGRYAPFVLGAGIFIAGSFRSNGILLLATLMVVVALEGSKRRKEGGNVRALIPDLLIPVMVYGLFRALESAVVGVSDVGGYAPVLEVFSWNSVWLNLVYYLKLPAQFFQQLPRAGILAGLLYLSAFLGGVWNARSERAWIVYLLLTLTLLVVWPYRVGLRLLYPALPLLLILSWMGLSGLITCLPCHFKKSAIWLVCAAWILSVLVLLNTSSKLVFQNLLTGPAELGVTEPASQDLFKYFRTQTPENARVAFRRPRAFKFMTGRDSILSIRTDIVSRADYLVWEKGINDLAQIKESTLNAFVNETHSPRVYESDKFVVYRLSDRAAQEADPAGESVTSGKRRSR